MWMNSMQVDIHPGNIQTATYQSISALVLAVAGATAGAIPATAGDGVGQATAGATLAEAGAMAGAGAIRAMVGDIRAGVGVQAGVTIHPITDTTRMGNAMHTTRAGSTREVSTMKEL